MSAGRPPAARCQASAQGRVRRLPAAYRVYAANLPLAGMEGDVEAMAMYAGQSVGAITEVEPAAAIVERFAAALRNG